MIPIKLIVIAILLYLGYRLLVSDWSARKDKKNSDPVQGRPDEGPVADVLVEDPICHKLVPKQQAIRLKSKLKDEIVYFCSEECCDLFVRQEGEQQ